MLLILDLDETLVYSTMTRLARDPEFTVGEYFVYRRPGLSAFLEFAAHNFQIAIWTSSTSQYAEQIVSHVFSNPSVLRFVWARERCTLRFDPESKESYWLKDLKKVKRRGFELEKTLIVDDSPEMIGRNYGNHIRVDSYRGDLPDGELPILAGYLARIRDVPNVRILDKRDWRRAMKGGVTGRST